jgi:hypothetical protein
VAAGLFLLLGQGRVKARQGLPRIPTEITAHGIAYLVIRHRVTVFFVREEFPGLRARQRAGAPIEWRH